MNDLIFRLLIYCIVGNVWVILRMLGRGEKAHREYIERETGLGAYGFGTTVLLLMIDITTIILWPIDVVHLIYCFVKGKMNKKRKGSD